MASQQFIRRGRGAQLFAVIVDTDDSALLAPRSADAETPPSSGLGSASQPGSLAQNPPVTGVSPREGPLPPDLPQVTIAPVVTTPVTTTPVATSPRPQSSQPAASPGPSQPPRKTATVEPDGDPKSGVRRLQDAVREWGNYCALCRRDQGETGAPGSITGRLWISKSHRCMHRSAVALSSQRGDLSAALASGGTTNSCVDCALPRRYCGSWRRVGKEWKRKGSGQCRFHEAVIPLVLGILLEDPDPAKLALLQWLQDDHVDCENHEAIIQWLAEEIVWSGLRCSRIAQVFTFLHEMIHNDAVLRESYHVGHLPDPKVGPNRLMTGPEGSTVVRLRGVGL